MIKFANLVPSGALALAICGASAPVNAQEAAGAANEDVIVVRGALVPEEKRATSEISSLLDAEDFARTGDSDIASALLRVTGISITDGKFPIARGLNERYTSATLNGVPLPSPEPLRRSAPLDLFPTRILAGSLAQKTFSPEFSGEFGGAAINLTTITIPDESFLQLTAGYEVDTESTFADGFYYDGSDVDIFGFDDGLRDLPAAAEIAYRQGIGAVGQTALDTSFEQDQTLLLTEEQTPGNLNLSGTAGYVLLDTADLRIGTTTFVGYNRDMQIRDAVADRRETISQVVSSDFLETRDEVALNALNTLGFEFGSDHEVNLTTFILRNTLKRGIVSTDRDDDVREDVLFRRESSDWIEREVWQAQLAGEHLFADIGDLEASWRVAYGEAERNAPYQRDTVRTIDEDGSRDFFVGEARTQNLNFSELQDENFYAGLDFVLPIPLFDRTTELKFGAAYTDKSRSNLRRDFDFGRAAGSLPAEVRELRTDLIYSDSVLSTDLLDTVIVAGSQFPDASEASLEVLAAYASADIELNDYLRASVGVRFEDSQQDSSVILTSDPASRLDFELEDDFLLPAVTLTWNPLGNLQVRGGYSETIARPQFRELAATDFTDPDLNVTLTGNPFLQNSEIKNYDIRGEYYFSRGQFVTLGVFYKEIENPIEQAFRGREANVTTFINAPAADLWGFEAEFEKTFRLEDMLDGDFFYGKELRLITNYTYSDSEVSDDGTVTVSRIGSGPSVFTGNTSATLPGSAFITDGRSLVGQSDHLFNFQLGFENIETGTTLTALLNWASDRTLFAEGTDELSIGVIEEPPLSLDLVLSQNVDIFGADYGLGVAVRNILADDFNAFREFDDGVERPFLEYDRGTLFSVSLSREF